MSKLASYLSFNGNCAEAMKFYETTLDGKLEFQMTWGESPMKDQMPANYADKIMHANLRIGGDSLMGCDAPPDRFKAAQGITVSVSIEDIEKAKQTFEKLVEGGNVFMPFGETFWAKGFGMGTDRFGIPWMVNCERPMNG